MPDLSGPRRPNVLFIQSDQHNASVTGCYGDPLVQTPNLDGLAARGVLMERAYCAYPICVPSRMSLLTGRYPYENEVWSNGDILDSAIPTYAHAMGAAGYRPVQIGRLHFNGPDQLHGFAERLVGDVTATYSGSRRPIQLGALEGGASSRRMGLQKSGPGQSSYQVYDEHVTAATIDYLNRLGVRTRSGEQTEPFSLSVGLILPHPPFVARKEDYDLYADVMTMPRYPEPFSERLHPYFQWWRQHKDIENVSDEEILRCRIAYWALVTRMDAMVGEILGALQRNGLSENTLIIYTTDHGESLGEHDLWWKQTFYEDSVRVPVIMSWPGVLPEGVRSSHIISQLDLNATMLEAVGAPPLPLSHGRSLLGLLLDPSKTAWDDVAYSEFYPGTHVEVPPDGVHTGPRGQYHRMIRRDDWKLNYYNGMEPQLFNLAEDPGEMRDLAQDPEHQQIRQQLTEQVLDGWDPEVIASKMSDTRRNQAVLQAWANKLDPPELMRWDMPTETNYLDGPAEGG